MMSDVSANISSKALKAVESHKPDLKAFDNGKEFNELHEQGNLHFIMVGYQDHTGEDRLVVPTTRFMMDYERVAEFREAIKVYHEKLRESQKAAFAEHDKPWESDTYYYFQRVGGDIGFSSVSLITCNGFMSHFETAMGSYFETEQGRDEELYEQTNIYTLLQQEGKYVLGNYSKNEQIECECHWQSFGRCHHSMKHVVTEATYNTMEEAVEGLINKESVIPMLVITDQLHSVVIERGQVTWNINVNQGSEVFEQHWAKHDKPRCSCTEWGECDYCLEQQYGSDEHSAQEGPFGGAFRDQEDYENYRFGGIAALNKS